MKTEDGRYTVQITEHDHKTELAGRKKIIISNSYRKNSYQ